MPSPAGRGFWHRPQRGDLDQPLSQPQGLSRQVHAPRCGKLLHTCRQMRGLGYGPGIVRGRRKNGLMRVDDPWQIRYRRT